MKVGYIIKSHVVYNHVALPMLTDSMWDCGVPRDAVVVIVNGCSKDRDQVVSGTRYIFRAETTKSHLLPIIERGLAAEMGVTHWFHLYSTMKCGPKFRELAEAGFDRETDATSASYPIPPAANGGKHRSMVDLCMYSNDYLLSQKGELESWEHRTSTADMIASEGLLFALAPKQAFYPGISFTSSDPTDVYGTGTPRRTEYHGAVDLYKFKQNWGQMAVGDYDDARL